MAKIEKTAKEQVECFNMFHSFNYKWLCREGDSDSDSDIEMSVISKGRHDIVVKQEGKIGGGFFKITKKHHPMYPFKEEKIKVGMQIVTKTNNRKQFQYDEYGEIVRVEDYKLADVNPEVEDNKENLDLKIEEDDVGKSYWRHSVIV